MWAPEDVNHPLWIERIRDGEAGRPVLFLLSQHAGRRYPQPCTSKAALTCIGSLLPQYRGRAPLNWVLVNGETETGVTLHRMVSRADAGAIVAQQTVAIGADDVALTLHRKLCAAASELLNQARWRFVKIKSGIVRRMKASHLRFVAVRRKMAVLDWDKPALTLHNLVRAVSDPWRARLAMLVRINLSSGNPACAGPGRGEARNGDVDLSAGDRLP